MTKPNQPVKKTYWGKDDVYQCSNCGKLHSEADRCPTAPHQKGKKIEKPFEISPGRYGNEFWRKTENGKFNITPTLAEEAILTSLSLIFDWINNHE